MSTTPTEEIRASSYVGFDSITAQIEHKLLKRGFQFNVIVVGTWSLNPSQPSINANDVCVDVQARRVWESRRSLTRSSRRI